MMVGKAVPWMSLVPMIAIVIFVDLNTDIRRRRSKREFVLDALID